jgi:hypothetical protein
MDELIKLVAQKTGLPADKAMVAVDTVVKFLKSNYHPASPGRSMQSWRVANSRMS